MQVPTAFPIDQAIHCLEKKVATLHVPIVDLIAVQTRDPFKVLVATILSARTKDEVTAEAAARLFKKAETPDALAKLSVAELEKLVFPVGFFRNKAAQLSKLPAVLAEKFRGRVPSEIDELTQLPGVGRKTANLVRSVAFGLPAICVDTHVHRIMNIWGYVATDTPLATEMALREKLPERYWIRINGLLVAFGQSICKPVAPHCDACPMTDICPKTGVTPRKIAQGKAGKPGAGKAGKPEKGEQAGGQLFLSWNVNGLRAVLGKGFLDILTRFDADIVGIQEIKATPEQLPPEIRELPGYHSYWHPAEKKGYSGVAAFSKKEPIQVYYGMGNPEFDREGRVLTLEFADFFFITAYFPNAQHELKRLDYKLAFNEAMLAHMNRLSAQKTVVLCGDFNVAHEEIDLARPKENRGNAGFSDEERAWMGRFLAAGYVDSFRQFCGEGGQYSWWSYRGAARARNIGWRIDYFVVDQKSAARLLEAGISQEVPGSDHCPVSLRFA